MLTTMTFNRRELLAIVTTFSVVVAQVNSLKCYSCRDCTSVTDAQLIECAGNNILTTTSTTSTTTSSKPTSPTTDIPSTTTDVPSPTAETTTNVPSSTTDISSSTTDVPSPTAETTTDIPSSTTDFPSPTADTTTTDISSSTTDLPSPTADTTTVIPSSTTDFPSPTAYSTTTELPSSTTDFPSPTAYSTTTELPSSTTDFPSPTVYTTTTEIPLSTTDFPSTADTTANDPSRMITVSDMRSNNPTVNAYSNDKQYYVTRVKRSLDLTNKLDAECTCRYGICNCGGKVFFASPRLSRVDETTYVCLQETLTMNTTKMVNRGCGVELNSTATSCIQSGFDKDCKVCKEDGCNASSALTYSLLLLVAPMLVLFSI